MLKWAGAILILGGATWGGFEFSRSLRERPAQLQLLRGSLQTLEAEIMYGHTPIQAAASKIAAQLPEPVSGFYRQFAAGLQTGERSVREAWEEALEHTWENSSFKAPEKEIMRRFGENLGKHDRHLQQKQILLALSHLEREEMAAREKQKHYENMVKSLGFLGGLLFIILLL